MVFASSSSRTASVMSSSSPSLHAHIDCFSGAAGDMLLAACVDASPDPKMLLREISDALTEMPGLAGEFELAQRCVLRGEGRLAARKVNVSSVYGDKAAPVPKDRSKDDDDNGHDHGHGHRHGHGHDHGHDHVNSLSHSHSHSHHDGPLRGLPEISCMINSAPSLPNSVKQRAVAAFTELARAEARVHGVVDIYKVHFHEVGAVDSIVDTVGTLIALDRLGVSSVSRSALPLSRGSVLTAHGVLPVPTPATAILLEGCATVPGPPGVRGECVTPTAAALLRVLCPDNDACPSMVLRSVGVGAGTKDFPGHPNVTRVLLGERTDGDATNAPNKLPTVARVVPTTSIVRRPLTDNTTNTTSNTVAPISSSFVISRSVAQLETNVDDATPEVLAHTAETLLSMPQVLDVWVVPILMKKGRPAHQLCCLCDNSDDASLDDVLTIIFRETTTFGVRVRRNVERASLPREFRRNVDGTGVDVRVGRLPDGTVTTVSPEYEHCRVSARSTGTPLRKVMDDVRRTAVHRLERENERGAKKKEEPKTREIRGPKVFCFETGDFV